MRNKINISLAADTYQKYTEISAGVYGTGGNKKYIGDLDNRICRFCGKDSTQTTFRKTAHAIPRSLGNNELFSNVECDICNVEFSEKLEVHLDKFTKHLRQAGQIKGRRGIPSYKSPDGKSRYDFGVLPTVQAPKDSSFLEIDESRKSFRLTYNIERHIPSAVYRALCRIAISTIPEHFMDLILKPTINWIADDNLASRLTPRKLSLYESFISGAPIINGVAVIVYKRKQDFADIPQYIGIISFGNLIFQFIIPCKNDPYSDFWYLPFFMLDDLKIIHPTRRITITTRYLDDNISVSPPPRWIEYSVGFFHEIPLDETDQQSDVQRKAQQQLHVIKEKINLIQRMVDLLVLIKNTVQVEKSL